MPGWVATIPDMVETGVIPQLVVPEFTPMLFLPPVLEQPAPLASTGPWVERSQATEASLRDRKPLLAFFAKDAAQREAVVAFLDTGEGAKVRASMTIWLPMPEDPAAAEMLDRLQIRSRPGLVVLDERGARPLWVRRGEECEPLASAFQAAQPPFARLLPGEAVQAWIGPGQKPDPFLAFAKARSGNLGAGALEPHRTFLAGLLSNGPEPLKGWAATRLVEADAPMKAFEPAPFPLFLELAAEDYTLQMIPLYRKNQRPAPPPSPSLGETGNLPALAPVLPVIRQQLRSADKPVLGRGMFAIMAKNLRQEDRDWILRQWTLFVPQMRERPASESVVYQMAANWLLSYGMAPDWDAFLAPAHSAWQATLKELRKAVQAVPETGKAPLGVLEDPPAFQAAFGIPRQDVVELEPDWSGSPAHLAQKAADVPYPREAAARLITGYVAVEFLVGTRGEVLWVRPLPGYPLAFLGPTALAHGAGLKFKPVTVAGKPAPFHFVAHLWFRIRR